MMPEGDGSCVRVFVGYFTTTKLLPVGLLGERNESDSLSVEVNGSPPRGSCEVWSVG